MITLALDTSTARGSVALLRDTDLLGKKNFQRARSADGLFDAISELLRRCGVTATEVDLFAVGTGPGSFTGIRAGIAAVRGLAMPAGRPIKAAVSFDALALDAAPQMPADASVLCVLCDARRGEVYSALYRQDGRPLRECRIGTLEEVKREAGETAWFVSTENLPGTTLLFPCAGTVGRLARERFLEERRGDERIEPLYLRATAYSTASGSATILGT